MPPVLLWMVLLLPPILYTMSLFIQIFSVIVSVVYLSFFTFFNYSLVTPTFALVFDNYFMHYDAMAFHTDIYHTIDGAVKFSQCDDVSFNVLINYYCFEYILELPSCCRRMFRALENTY